MTELTIPKGWAYFKLPATKEKLEFWGTCIDSVDNDSGDRLRWAELRLYKYIDSDETHNAELPGTDPFHDQYGKQAYLLYTIGHSLVVHEYETDCDHKGIIAPVSQFPQNNEDHEDLEPCPACRPVFTTVDDEDPERILELETTWYSYTECPTPDHVLLALRKPPSCKTCEHKKHPARDCKTCRCDTYVEGPRPLSSPGERLVKQVSAVDPGIAAAAHGSRKL